MLNHILMLSTLNHHKKYEQHDQSKHTSSLRFAMQHYVAHSSNKNTHNAKQNITNTEVYLSTPPTTTQKVITPQAPSHSTSHLPYSKLGTITGPYFIGALYPPSFCTMKSTARLNFPLPCPLV
jgi:hypothetical protein